jgi:RNA polymerase sigma factor (sigma-70 family)
MSSATGGEMSDEATEIFTEHRELLFSIVYNMLGTVADTEDVLQEAWVAWARRTATPEAAPIDNPRAYLVRIAVREALAAQQTIHRRRETYQGPWLPEPLVEPLTGAPATSPDVAETAIRNESLSMALLVVLETLTPLERAVFVLGEVFGYPYTEIAQIVDRTPAAVRQLAHRAREHVQARRPRFQTDPQVRREITEQFLAALLGGDLEALMRLLAPEVTIWTDGGGKARAAGLRGQQPRERVAKMLAVGGFRPHPGIGFRYRLVNGDPAVVLLSEGAPFAVLVLDFGPDVDEATGVCAITGVYAVTNPDKLTHVY